VAFVLSGGGNLGALQVGMLRALADREIRPDLVVGCSVGALNGAAYAADPTPAGVARLEALWRGLEGDEIMPTGWLPTSVQLARKGASLHDNEGLKATIDRILFRETFGELEVPFQCVATSIQPVGERWFATGALKPAILASAALPAVFPVVEIDGVPYFDGAVVNDVPVSRAVELGARTIYVLHVGNLDRPWIEPKRPIDVAIQAYWIARKHRLSRDLAALPPHVDLVMLPRGEPTEPRFDDFSRTEELINLAYGATAAHLDALAGADEVESPAMPVEDHVPALGPESEIEPEN
jgi:NTE family protein